MPNRLEMLAEEVFSTERNTVEKLHKLVQSLQEINQSKPDPEVKALLDLVQPLNDVIQKNSPLFLIGKDDTYKQKLTKLDAYYQSDSFKQYAQAITDYVNKFEAVIELSDRLDKKQAVSGTSIGMVTSMPMQRIMRHNMMANEVVRLMAKPEIDSSGITFGNGVNAADGAALAANSSKRVVEQLDNIKDTFKVSSRRLFRKGKVEQRQQLLDQLEQNCEQLISIQFTLAMDKDIDIEKVERQLEEAYKNVQQCFVELGRTTKDADKMQALNQTEMQAGQETRIGIAQAYSEMSEKIQELKADLAITPVVQDPITAPANAQDFDPKAMAVGNAMVSPPLVHASNQSDFKKMKETVKQTNAQDEENTITPRMT